MCKLNELIEEYCPEGVEYKTIESLCRVITPKIKILKLDYSENGKYPIIDQSANFISGYTDMEPHLIKMNM